MLFKVEKEVTEFDGAPLSDIDGAPISDIDGLPLVKSDDYDGQAIDDVDGAPMLTEEVDEIPHQNSVKGETGAQNEPAVPKFKPSKWESVDENELENQGLFIIN